MMHLKCTFVNKKCGWFQNTHIMSCLVYVLFPDSNPDNWSSDKWRFTVPVYKYDRILLTTI